MKYALAAAAFVAFTGNAFAADVSCMAQATEKKLAGAAMSSFMTKCEKDAKDACDLDSKAKKLAGAALDAHMKKCVTEKVGAAAAPEAKPAAAAPAAKPAEAAKPADPGKK